HQQIVDPRARLPVKAQIKFLDLAAVALKDDCLGFHLAQKFDLRTVGLLYYVLASSDTLDDALQRAARYSAIVNEGITLRFHEGKNIGISFEYAGVARHSDCHQIEFAMVALLRTCRQLANRHLRASRVSFTHRRSNDTSGFRTFFGSDITFSAAVDELAFSSSIKKMPILSADPYLNDLFGRVLRASNFCSGNKTKFLRIERRERPSVTFATWQSAGKCHRSQTRSESADVCTTSGI